MTDEQVETIVAYLASAYRVELSRGTILVWRDIIASVDFGTARTAAKRIVTSDAQFMPTPGAFLSVCHQIALTRFPQQPALSDATGQPVPPEVARKNIAKIKAELRAHPIKRA